MHDLLIATRNPGKLIELRALLLDLPVRVVSPSELRLMLDVAEDGATYVDNAVKKAVAYAAAAGLSALADDTGLEVEVLGGAPGLHSKRYLPDPNATDADRRALLLRNLAGKPRPWLAHFRAVVAISTANGVSRWADGMCDGEIVPEERGAGGFGYDRLFVVGDLGLTMAELDVDVKNRVSHRGQAMRRVLPLLQEMLGL